MILKSKNIKAKQLTSKTHRYQPINNKSLPSLAGKAGAGYCYKIDTKVVLSLKLKK